MERIDRQRSAKGLHPRAHPGQPLSLWTTPGADAVVGHGDDELPTQARALHSHNNLHTFGMSMTGHIAQSLLGSAQNRDLHSRGQAHRQIQLKTSVQSALALDAHEAPQRLGEISVLESTGTLTGNERTGLGEIVTANRLQLIQTANDHSDLTAVQLATSSLRKGDDRDEPLRQSVVDLAGPALVLGRDSGGTLSGGELALGVSQRREHLLLVRKHPDDIDTGRLDPGQPGPAEKRYESLHHGAHPPRPIALGKGGGTDAQAEDELHRRRHPEPGMNQP